MQVASLKKLDIGGLGVFLVGVLLTTLAFEAWMPFNFFGDDLANRWDYLQGAFPADLIGALTQTPADKYRPVFHWLMGTLFGVFDDSIRAYLFFNVLLHAINATLVFYIASDLGKRNCVVALAAAALVVTSRFCLYQVTQVTGLLEGLAFTFFLLSLLLNVRAAQADIARRETYVLSGAFAALLAFATHERYVVYVAWLALVLLLRPQLVGRPMARWSAFSILTVAVPAYFLVKSYALGAPGLVGTGGRALSFEWARALGHSREALLSVFGNNYGPEWLIGVSGRQLGPFYQVGALAVVAAWIIGIALAGRSIGQAAKDGSSGSTLVRDWISALALLTIAMILPTLATIRLEQRWLVQPFTLIVLMLCAALSVLNETRRLLAIGIGAVFFVLQAMLNAGYAKHLEAVSFVYAAQFAKEIDGVSRAAGLPLSIAILGAEEHCNWTLQRGRFFLYRYGLDVKLVCFSDLTTLLRSELPDGTLVLRQTKIDGGLLNVTKQVADRGAAQRERVLVDLVASFSSGRVRPEQEVDSASKRGSLAASWEGPLGAEPSVTVISGFAHTYTNVAVGNRAKIKALAGMVYPSNYGTTAIIRARRAGQREIVAQSFLRPRSKSGEWFQTPMELALDAPGEYTVELEVQTAPGSDSRGHWVAFTGVRIIDVDELDRSQNESGKRLR